MPSLFIWCHMRRMPGVGGAKHPPDERGSAGAAASGRARVRAPDTAARVRVAAVVSDDRGLGSAGSAAGPGPVPESGGRGRAAGPVPDRVPESAGAGPGRVPGPAVPEWGPGPAAGVRGRGSGARCTGPPVRHVRCTRVGTWRLLGCSSPRPRAAGGSVALRDGPCAARTRGSHAESEVARGPGAASARADRTNLGAGIGSRIPARIHVSSGNATGRGGPVRR